MLCISFWDTGGKTFKIFGKLFDFRAFENLKYL